MSIQRSKTTTIKGCSVWVLDRDSGNPITETPQADNVTVTIPNIEFGTTDVNILGNLSVPDFTRLDNFQVTVNVSVDNPDTKPLLATGLVSWKIRYAIGHVDVESGLETLVPFTYYVKGYVTSIPNSSIEQGGDGKADINMNVVAIKKQRYSDYLYDINRLTGTVIIDGESKTSELSNLY